MENSKSYEKFSAKLWDSVFSDAYDDTVEKWGEEDNKIDQWVKDEYFSMKDDYEYNFKNNHAKQMKKYLNSEDTSIPGNFNNIRRDVQKDFGESFDEFKKHFEEDTATEEEIEFLVDWFVETFGTYNWCYNLSNEMGERYYTLEQEEGEEDSEESFDESKKKELLFKKIYYESRKAGKR